MVPTRPWSALEGRLLLLAVAALLVAGTGCGPIRGRTSGVPEPTGPGGDGVSRPVLPACGEPSRALTPGAGPLTVAGDFPPATRSGDTTVTGTVTVTARARVTGLSAPVAGVYVAREGRVVATPVASDLIGVAVSLAPGASQSFPATGSLQACPASTGGGGNGGPLPPGSYDLFAAVTVTDDAGVSVTATGGPWPLEVG